MNARNLGVVFGRQCCPLTVHLTYTDVLALAPPATLIKSPDPGAEFSDMAQRALFVEWLVEHTPQLFKGTI